MSVLELELKILTTAGRCVLFFTSLEATRSGKETLGASTCPEFLLLLSSDSYPIQTKHACLDGYLTVFPTCGFRVNFTHTTSSDLDRCRRTYQAYLGFPWDLGKDEKRQKHTGYILIFITRTLSTEMSTRGGKRKGKPSFWAIFPGT